MSSYGYLLHNFYHENRRRSSSTTAPRSGKQEATASRSSPSPSSTSNLHFVDMKEKSGTTASSCLGSPLTRRSSCCRTPVRSSTWSPSTTRSLTVSPLRTRASPSWSSLRTEHPRRPSRPTTRSTHLPVQTVVAFGSCPSAPTTESRRN